MPVLMDDLPWPSRCSLIEMLVSLVFRLTFACRSFIVPIRTNLQNEDKAQSHHTASRNQTATQPDQNAEALRRDQARFDPTRILPQTHAMANTFGHLFRITTWGESHGGGVGVVVDGCPPRLKLSEADIQPDLDRRRPGQSRIVSPRREPDTVQILSGLFGGKTLGTPICLWVKNEDARPEAYAEMETKFRPSHADYTYFAKFGIRAWPGGGRTSARETIGRVAAGAIAKKILRERFGVEVLAYVKQVQRLMARVDPEKVRSKDIESNIVRCPDQAAAQKMIRLIERIRRAGDSVGGTVEGVARGVPPGWGEP